MIEYASLCSKADVEIASLWHSIKKPISNNNSNRWQEVGSSMVTNVHSRKEIQNKLCPSAVLVRLVMPVFGFIFYTSTKFLLVKLLVFPITMCGWKRLDHIFRFSKCCRRPVRCSGVLQNLPTSGQGVIQVHCRVHVLWPNDFFELFRVEQPVLFSAVV